MADNIQVSISQDSVQEIIRTHVTAAVSQALLPHKEAFVKRLVEESLLRKTDGKDGEHRYKQEHEKPTLLEDMVRRIIAEEAAAGIKAWAETNRELIAKNIKASFNKSKFGADWAMQMVESMVKATEYTFKVQVTPHINK